MASDTSGGSIPTSQTFEITAVEQALADAPVLQIDGAHTFSISEDRLVRFNLYQDRLLSRGQPVPEQPPVARTVCLRLVMSLTVFNQLTDWLSKNSEQISNLQVGGEGD